MSYIDPRGKVMAHLDRIAGWRAGQKPGPVTIEWDLSNRCTLGCQDCHFAYTHTRGPWAVRDRALPMAYDGVGDLADAALVQATLYDAKEMGVRSIVWSGGGEPTTHPEWQAIIEWADVLQFQQGMYTHGGLLTEKSAKHLADRAAWVVVSLDCLTSETYAKEKGVHNSRFDAACQGVRWLAGRKATVGVSFLLHADNWERAAWMLWLARQLGATYATFRPTVQTQPSNPGMKVGNWAWIADAEPMLEALALEPDVEIDPDRFRAYRDWSGHGYDTCMGIRLVTTITPDGRVWVCPNRRGMEDSCLGDLKQDSLQEIWAKHPGMWTNFTDCRVLCRLHPVNEVLAAIEAPRAHEAFI